MDITDITQWMPCNDATATTEPVGSCGITAHPAGNPATWEITEGRCLQAVEVPPPVTHNPPEALVVSWNRKWTPPGKVSNRIFAITSHLNQEPSANIGLVKTGCGTLLDLLRSELHTFQSLVITTIGCYCNHRYPWVSIGNSRMVIIHENPSVITRSHVY